MNDRFKFRVWDNENNKYIYDAEYTYDNPHGDCFSDLIEGTYGSFTVEQCTGLKDKNGRLIYEGDIVVKTDVNGIGYPRTRICRVYWKEDWLGWVIKTEYGDVYALADYGSDNYEVIGNIHENPELLEE